MKQPDRHNVQVKH